jgi:hypothetical protein
VAVVLGVVVGAAAKQETAARTLSANKVFMGLQ